MRSSFISIVAKSALTLAGVAVVAAVTASCVSKDKSRGVASVDDTPLTSHAAFADVPEKTKAAAMEILSHRMQSEREYRKTDPPGGPANLSGEPAVRRDTHAKTHACVKADFQVNSDVPQEFRVGLFANPGASYKAWIRFANGLGQLKHDIAGDARAMSVKIMGVKGPKVLADFSDEELFTQDIIMNNAPTFFLDNAEDSKAFFGAEASGAINKFFVTSLINPVYPDGRKMVFNVLNSISKVEKNLLRASYWSVTPYSFGPDMKVKWVTNPCADRDYSVYRGLPDLNAAEKAYTSKMGVYYRQFSPLVKGNPDFPDMSYVRSGQFVAEAFRTLKLDDKYASQFSPTTHDYLRDNIVADLGEGRSGCFDIGIQVYTDEKNTPIEKPTIVWKSKVQWLGQIKLPAQVGIASDEQIGFCENLSFNPWHALNEHKPLGELNTIRGMIYRGMSAHRHMANGKAGGEPLDTYDYRLVNQSEANDHYR